MVRRNIVLSDEMDNELDSAARRLGRKRSELVGKALAFYLDYLDLDLARQRAAAYEAGQDKGLSAEELRKELEL